MNRDYQKYGKANYEQAVSAYDDYQRSSQPTGLLDQSVQKSWGAYENFLDCYDLREPAKDKMRGRNRAFADFLKQRDLYSCFEDHLFRLPEAEKLATLKPRIFREQQYQDEHKEETSCHEAYSSDFARYVNQQQPKESIARLLQLLYTVRCNLDHNQKILPQDDWPEIKARNVAILQLVAPIQMNLARLLFESVWADGVFVYGTCKPTEGNFERIRHAVRGREDGWWVWGKLLNLGSYPGLIQERGARTKGWVLKTERLAELLGLMDELEGTAFTRRLLWAQKGNEGLALAWTYFYTGSSAKAPRWPDDEWHS